MPDLSAGRPHTVPFESWHLRRADGSPICCQVSFPESPASRHGVYCFTTVNCLEAAGLETSQAPSLHGQPPPSLRVVALSGLPQVMFLQVAALIKLCCPSPCLVPVWSPSCRQYLWYSTHREGPQEGRAGRQEQSPRSCLSEQAA